MAEIVYVRDANGNLIQTTIEDLREERIAELEEENKKLKEENRILKELIRGATEQLKELKEKLNKAGLEEYGFFNEY